MNRPTPPRAPLHARFAACALAIVCVAAACGEREQPADLTGVIERETFIDTYVDLRVAAVTSPEFRISSERRAEVLARHGVDSEALIRFADAHGRDLDYMAAVWSEVETRLQERAGEAPK